MQVIGAVAVTRVVLYDGFTAEPVSIDSMVRYMAASKVWQQLLRCKVAIRFVYLTMARSHL